MTEQKIDEVKQIANEYVRKEVENIINVMIKTRKTYLKISTCDHYNWDVELHYNFPAIAQRLRERGFNVSSSINFGVTDWIIIIST